MTDAIPLSYHDPWAVYGQPRVRRLERLAWYTPRRYKVQLVDDYWIAIPHRVRAKCAYLPMYMMIPRRFICDLRSVPLGALLDPAHPAGLSHDWGYRVADEEHIEDMDMCNAALWTRVSRRDLDVMFREHLKAVAMEHPLPRRVLHHIARPPQYWAVRVFGGWAYEEARCSG